MKTLFALLGCSVLAWNVASANVDCAKAPFGESVAQYGRDEFQLGIIAVMHNNKHPTIPQAMIEKIDQAMRSACRAKFQGEGLSRYMQLGLPPAVLKTQSVGSIAALTVQWNASHVNAPTRAPSASSAAGGSLSHEHPRRMAHPRNPPAPTENRYTTIASSFPACPRKVDIERLLKTLLIDKAEWPVAVAASKRHGCIELHAGERVYPLRREIWNGLVQVRPEGRARAYWTDTLAVK